MYYTNWLVCIRNTKMISLKLMRVPIDSVLGFIASPVVAFYYQLDNLLFHHHFHVHYCHTYVYVMMEGLSNITTQNMLPTMWLQKIKLDDRKN